MITLKRLRAAISHAGVRTQLMAAFGTVLVLTAVLGAVALYSLNRVNADAALIANKWLAGVSQPAETRAAVISAREFEIKHSRTDDKSYQSEYEDKMAELAKRVVDLMAAYKARVAGDEETALMAAYDKSWAAYVDFQKKVIKMGRDKQQQDAADIADGASSMAVDESLGALRDLLAFNEAGAQAAATHAADLHSQSQAITAVLLLLALAAGLALALAITRNLLNQLGGEPHSAVLVVKAVAEGDLSTRITLKPGDRDSIMAWLQTMQSNLSQAVSQVRQGSDQVATASAQIAKGNQDLSSRTEQQASALQQTAATMEELGSTVRSNADNAREASQLAQKASSVAVQGGAVVGEVVETMKGINQSSRRIADIIGTIDGIAFQANILALNAAVEAARAGEQGRGFAVVAGEVRSLAQRSAEAAKEIKALITASVERVDHGSTLVDGAGKTMSEVVRSIQRVTHIVAEISAASTEQSNGVGQVGEAVTQMDQSTQQNAALVEESTAAAESLRKQATQLVQAVAVFKLA
ncbi:MAG: methyl-accepting chemotaxis protein [Leptothrix sp. (in: Bacteria)]|nr:methyl-accepting chemotaxis protein [Leptothrix sp. (in: b-proteobacteria)]